ncbi:galactokinase [Brachyspira pilosicoli]|uniref:Galactokinase n=5 Tax=Brachyspira pilosicoli TaxID=52584 RepID=D8IA21_BRAP9|nr:galactokinase [Brachyspira pilosicoli]ADK30138.1 putative galactokinase [Brachyspira pilosicoli 95/1000]AFR70758.1 putative galactokinase [Brachyspira pilosicoli B2904]AGA65809.1 putative galactokinase [Brachyspira pilosicoli P43/6/78]MBW5382450.1 galactokinase [Brachyspira pilosicoli]MBW5391255.1 galactokinase [Brachyspira pilosicoli]
MIPKLHLRLVERFRDVFGQKGEVKLYFAPGRLTFIGELIDYSGGDTITAAVDRGTYLVVRKRPDNKINIYGHSFKAKKSFTFNELEKNKEDEWAIYFKGVFSVLLEREYKITGMDIYAYTDLPFNTSLASSSSLCACLTYAIFDVNGLDKSDIIELAKLSYEGEIKYASHRTSLSDHITIFLGKENSLLLFNMFKMSYEYLDINFGEYCVAVVNSNKKRTSSDSEYNARKRECDNALKKLKEKKSSIKFLSDLKPKDADFIKETLQNKEQRRALYVSSEEDRVNQAVKAIKKGAIKDLAALISKTHDSLSKLYEVSTAEQDILVEEASKMDGVLGARMIGTGFGGGVLILLKKTEVENVIEALYTNYKEKTRRDADVYIVKPTNGVRMLSIE